jgi:hypothetical protein
MPLRCLRLAVPLTIPLPHEPHGFRAMARALEDKERALLQVKRSLESVQVDAANAQIAVAELEKTRLQLKLKHQQDKRAAGIAAVRILRKPAESAVHLGTKIRAQSPDRGSLNLSQFVVGVKGGEYHPDNV